MASRKETLLKELQELEDSDTVGVEEEVETPIQRDKTQVDDSDDTVDAVEVAEPIQKVKKPRTEKQIAAFAKAKVVRDNNTLARKAVRETSAAADKKVLEAKLVKKAIAVKKRQIKQQAVLDSVDDESVDETVHESGDGGSRGVPVDKIDVADYDAPPETPKRKRRVGLREEVVNEPKTYTFH